MIKLFIFILIVYGLSTIVVQSTLFEPVRGYISSKNSFMGKLFKCMLCFGFWASIVISIFCYSPTTDILDLNNLSFIFDGFLGAASTWLVYLIQLNLEKFIGNEL